MLEQIKTKHLGDFAKIIDGVNNTIGSLVGLLDNMPAPCMIINTDYEIQYMNKAGASLNNTTPEQLINSKTHCWDHFKTSDCRSQNCACNSAIQTGKESIRETDAHPGNLNLEISYTGVPIRNKDGKVIGAFEVVVDQTEIKNASKLAKKVAVYQETETNKVTENLLKLSKGNININAISGSADSDTNDAKAKFDTINNAINDCVKAVSDLVIDANDLSRAAVEGKLDTRADASKHQGDFRTIVQGVNNTLDSVIGPLNVAAEYVDRISKGDIPPKIPDEYKGDFNEIKGNINQLIDNVNMIVKGIDRVVINVIDGNLTDRGNDSLFNGEWKKLVEGINHIIDAFVNPINTMADFLNEVANGDELNKITDEYKGDFNKIKYNINTCIEVLYNILGDTGMLAKAAC